MNLTPEQLELLFCLLGALALGFLFGYLLSKSFAKSSYGVEIEELSDLLDTRDRELESASAKHGQLKQHLAVQANELKDLNQKITDSHELINQYESNTKLLSDEKIELESLLTIKEKKISMLSDEVDLSKNELAGVQSLVNEYKNTNSANNDKLLAAQNEVEQSIKLNHSLVEKSEEQKLAMETLKKSIDEKDNVINEYKKRTSAKEIVERENQELKLKIENLSKELQESKSTIVKHDDSELISLKERYTNLQQSLEKSNKEIERKETSILGLQKSFDDSKKEIADKDISISNLQKERSEWAEQIKTIQNNQDSSQDSLQNEILNIKAELFRKDQKLKLAEEKLRLNQPSKNILSDKDSSYLAESKSSNESTGFMKFVKNTFSGSKNK